MKHDGSELIQNKLVTVVDNRPLLQDGQIFLHVLCKSPNVNMYKHYPCPKFTISTMSTNSILFIKIAITISSSPEKFCGHRHSIIICLRPTCYRQFKMCFLAWVSLLTGAALQARSACRISVPCPTITNINLKSLTDSMPKVITISAYIFKNNLHR